MRALRAGSSSAVALALLIACSGGGDGPSTGGPQPPPPPPPPPPTTGAARIDNLTGFPIHEAYASPSASPDWGVVQNPAPIPTSSSFTLTNLAPGLWDFMAVSIGALSPYFSYALDQTIVAGFTLVFDVQSTDFTGSLNVSNGDPFPVTGLFVVPAEATTWGANQLTSAIAPGGSFLLYDIPPGTVDVQCVHSDGAFSTGRWQIASFSVTSITCL